MSKIVKRYLIILVVLLAVIFLLQKIKWLPSFGEIFTPKEITIDSTPVLVKEINNLAQLVTVTAYNELVIDSVKKPAPLMLPMPPLMIPLPSVSLTNDRIVLIGKGKVLAGVDLQKLKETDIVINNDSVSMQLPAAEILQVITNPSDFETFEETGTWADPEVRQIKERVQRKLTTLAIEQNILTQAANRAKLIMENFLHTTGFQKVTVSVKNI